MRLRFLGWQALTRVWSNTPVFFLPDKVDHFATEWLCRRFDGHFLLGSPLSFSAETIAEICEGFGLLPTTARTGMSAHAMEDAINRAMEKKRVYFAMVPSSRWVEVERNLISQRVSQRSAAPTAPPSTIAGTTPPSEIIHPLTTSVSKPESTTPIVNDAQLASTPGNSPAQRNAREKIAQDFYLANCPTFAKRDIVSHVKCIDLSQPVSVIGIPPDGGGNNGDRLWQHAFPGRVGQYFALDDTTTAPQLGAHSRVLLPADGNIPPRIVPRQQVRHIAQRQAPVRGIRSTAAPALDTWSISGQPQSTPGGGIQVMVPKNQHAQISQVSP